MKKPDPKSQAYNPQACAQAGRQVRDYTLDLLDYADWLRELLIETRAQIGMNTCGGDMYAPRYWAFLEHMARALDLNPNRLCEPGYPKWEPSYEEGEKAIDHFVAEGVRQFKEKYGND